MNKETKTVDLDDLPEDPIITSQKYVVISYAFSEDVDRNGNRLPLLKIRGSYPTIDACNKRIKRLDDESEDVKSIPLLITEVGKWIGLFDHSELYKNDEIDIQYRDEQMNSTMKGLRESSMQNKQKFLKRVDDERKELEYYGSKEGQEELAEKKEHPLSVIQRQEHFSHSVEVLREKLKESEEKLEEAIKKLATYSEEEIQEAKKQAEESQNNKP